MVFVNKQSIKIVGLITIVLIPPVDHRDVHE